MTREVMQQAITALGVARDACEYDRLYRERTIKALSEALAQPSEPTPVRASDLPVTGSVMLDAEMREWAQARNMHLYFSVGSWHVMIGRTWCTTGYDTPQKALEACWESGEYDDIEKCGVAHQANRRN